MLQKIEYDSNTSNAARQKAHAQRAAVLCSVFLRGGMMKHADENQAALGLLRSNGRMQLKDISARTHIPISTLFDRLRNEFPRFISKYTALLNFPALGFDTRAFITLKVLQEEKERMRLFFEQQKCLNALYKINNGYDFMVEVVFRTLAELEQFIEQLNALFTLKEMNTYCVISDIHREQFLTDAPKARRERKVYNQNAISAAHGDTYYHGFRRH